MHDFLTTLEGVHLAATDWQGTLARLAAEPAAWPLILGGLALLFFGRRLYWLALGGLGAAVAVTLAQHLDLPTPEGRLVVALLAAIAGALLAIFAQRLVVSTVGFLAGVAAGAWLTPLVWPEPGLWLLLIVFVTGIFGLVLAGKLFEGLLIVATSAAGAWLVVEALPQLGGHAVWVLAALFLVGLVAQTRGRPQRRRRLERAREEEA